MVTQQQQHQQQHQQHQQQQQQHHTSQVRSDIPLDSQRDRLNKKRPLQEISASSPHSVRKRPKQSHTSIDALADLQAQEREDSYSFAPSKPAGRAVGGKGVVSIPYFPVGRSNQTPSPTQTLKKKQNSQDHPAIAPSTAKTTKTTKTTKTKSLQQTESRRARAKLLALAESSEEEEEEQEEEKGEVHGGGREVHKGQGVVVANAETANSEPWQRFTGYSARQLKSKDTRVTKHIRELKEFHRDRSVAQKWSWDNSGEPRKAHVARGLKRKGNEQNTEFAKRAKRRKYPKHGAPSSSSEPEDSDSSDPKPQIRGSATDSEEGHEQFLSAISASDPTTNSRDLGLNQLATQNAQGGYGESTTAANAPSSEEETKEQCAPPLPQINRHPFEDVGELYQLIARDGEQKSNEAPHSGLVRLPEGDHESAIDLGATDLKEWTFVRDNSTTQNEEQRQKILQEYEDDHLIQALAPRPTETSLVGPNDALESLKMWQSLLGAEASVAMVPRQSGNFERRRADEPSDLSTFESASAALDTVGNSNVFKQLYTNQKHADENEAVGNGDAEIDEADPGYESKDDSYLEHENEEISDDEDEEEDIEQMTSRLLRDLRRSRQHDKEEEEEEAEGGLEGKYSNPLKTSFARTKNDALRDHDSEYANRRLKDRLDVKLLDDRLDGKNEGMHWFDKCFELADAFKDERSPDQVRFHEAIFNTCAPIILGSDYLFMREELMRRFGRTEPNMAAMIMTPRRWGKTTAVSMALACLMYCCRGVNIVVFSTGQKMSTALMDKVRGYFMELDGAESRVCTNNTKEFTVTHAGTPSEDRARCEQAGLVNRLQALAATVQGNKGITADIFVLEEASRIPKQILHEVIAPMMKVANSVLIALSTHLGEDNYYTKLFESNHPAVKRLFLKLRVEVMCAACKRKKKDPTECTHMDHLHPAWLLSSNAERVKILMEGDSKMYAQEALGVIWSDKRCVYKKEWLNAFEARLPVDIKNTKGYFIMTMIDPAGSGDSQTGICSVVRVPHTGELIIVGLAEADPLDVEDITEMIQRYMQGFNRHPILGKMDHVLSVESNYGGPIIANMFYEIAKSANANLFEFRPNTDMSGFVTNHQNKNAAVISSMCDMFENRIHFYKDLVTLDPTVVDATKKEFFSQCGRLQKKFKSNGNHTYSAKVHSGDGQGQDDMLIAFVMASLNHRIVAQKVTAMYH